jgi:hypothetical protein
MIICRGIVVALACQPAIAFSVGEAGVEFGQSSNAYVGSQASSSQFASADAKIGCALFGADNRSQIIAGAKHREYFSEPDANTSYFLLDTAYQGPKGATNEYGQRLSLLADSAPNFLRQRLSTYTIHSASTLTTQFESSDFVLTIPIQAKLYDRETDRRSNQIDMFESRFKEDNYMVGVDAAWRQYFDQSFQSSLLIGLTSDIRFFVDKPVTKKDGGLDESKSLSTDSSSDIQTRLKAAYRRSGTRFGIEPGIELTHGYDLKGGSEDYLGALANMLLRFRTRVLEVSNKLSYDHRSYLSKRAGLANKTQASKLRLTSIQNDFKTLYKITKQLNTGGGLHYQKLQSSYSPDGFDVKEVYGFISFEF